MSKAKRYSVPIVLGIIAVALLAVGALALTVWRPAQQVSATHNPTEPFAMIRAGVFPLYADSVRINVTAEPDQDVWLAVGSPEDITAWLQDEPYEEIVGLLDLQTLKTIPHGVEANPQSGEAQSGRGAESVEEPQSGAQAASPISSDMWVAENYGRGSVSLTLSGDDMGLSILAATDGVGPAPTLTLTWQTPQSNLLAVASFIGAAIATIMALIIAVSLAGAARRRASRSEALRTLDERASTDTAEIATLPELSTTDHVESTNAISVEATETADPTEVVAEDAAETVESIDQEVDDVTPSRPDADSAGDADLAGDADSAGDEELSVATDDMEAKDKPSTKDDQPSRLEASRSETVTTDSGMMNLSALQQGGGSFPTRRALRDAHRRGVSRLVVGEREFTTTATPTEEDPTPDRVLHERSVRPNKWSEAMGDVEQ